MNQKQITRSISDAILIDVLSRYTSCKRWVKRTFVVSQYEIYRISKKSKSKVSVQLNEVTRVCMTAEKTFTIEVDQQCVLVLKTSDGYTANHWCSVLRWVVEKNKMKQEVMNGTVREKGMQRGEVGKEVGERVELGEARLGPADFKKLSVIGHGGYSTVFLVQQIGTEAVFAMKVMKKSVIRRTNFRKQMMNELEILANIDHPFFIKAHHAFQTDEHLFLLMDFVNGGEMFTHVSQCEGFSEARARFYIAEIILAMEYLHEQNVVFRDLKSENILIKTDGHIVIIDFGLAKCIGDTQLADSRCGTFDYMCPEQILGEEYSFEVDWWAVGVLLFELLTGYLPFSNDHSPLEETIENVLHANIKYPFTVSIDAEDLVECLTDKNKNTRLTSLAKIKSHTFFSSINWDDLQKNKVAPPFIPTPQSSTDCRYIDRCFLKIPCTTNFSDTGYSLRDSFSSYYL